MNINKPKYVSNIGGIKGPRFSVVGMRADFYIKKIGDINLKPYDNLNNLKNRDPFIINKPFINNIIKNEKFISYENFKNKISDTIIDYSSKGNQKDFINNILIKQLPSNIGLNHLADPIVSISKDPFFNVPVVGFSGVTLGLAALGIYLDPTQELNLNPERAFLLAMQRAAGISIYTKATLLTVARQVSPSVLMEPSAPPYLDKKEDKSERTNEKIYKDAANSLRWTKRALILLKEGSAYIKPVSGARSVGVAKIEIRNGKLVLITGDADLQIRVLAYFRPGKRPSGIAFSASEKNNDKVLYSNISCDAESIDKLVSFFESYENMMIQAKVGPTLLEGAIKTPLINGGSTWEVRIINQTLDGDLRQASYAKIGADGYIANIAVGGHGAASLAAIQAGYRSLFDQMGRQSSDEEIAMLSDAFLNSALDYARKIKFALDGHFNELKGQYLPEYPFDVELTDFSTDFMGRIIEDPILGCKLEPHVVDINFYYAYEGLKDTDSYAAAAVNERGIDIKIKFLKQLSDFGDHQTDFIADQKNNIWQIK